MNRFRTSFLSTFGLIALIILSSCSFGKKDGLKEPHLTPLPPALVDPSDFVLKQSLLEIFKETKGPLNSTYIYKRVDLDNDGRRDALVLMKTPYGFWCGTHGCTMLILKAHNNVFALINAIQTVRPPIFISQQETNGWKNIILRVSGRSSKAKDVALEFDGHAYPKYPDTVPPISTHEYAARIKLFD